MQTALVNFILQLLVDTELPLTVKLQDLNSIWPPDICVTSQVYDPESLIFALLITSLGNPKLIMFIRLSWLLISLASFFHTTLQYGGTRRLHLISIFLPTGEFGSLQSNKYSSAPAMSLQS